MGFMDKLKAMKNFVTGGGAEISVEIDGEPKIGGTFPVTIRASVKDAPLKVARVYVLIRGQETVEFVRREFEDGEMDRDRVRESHSTFQQEITLTDGAIELPANSQHEWTGELSVPDHCQPTYEGHRANHYYEVQAALDVSGNDPDSGWIRIIVK